MRTSVCRASLVAAVVAIFGIPMSVSAQAQGNTPQQPSAPQPQVRRLTVDEAVRLAAENNLGIQVARFNPQIEDLNVAQARAAWAPSVSTTFQQNSTDNPNNNVLSGATGGSAKTSSDQFTNNVGVQQVVPWGGGSYSVGWDSTRTTSTSSLSNFTPELRSSLALSFTQPLLRGFRIDSTRQQIQVSQKNREIADVQLRQSLATTTRTVRNAYWDLAYAIAFLQVQQQSLDLAQESLRNTRARVEIGTTPPIDIVQAESEVAQREESVILAQAQIATSEDTLRTLIYDPRMADFWTIRIEPAELFPPFQPIVVDVDGAMRNALDRRTDLQQTRKQLEATSVNIRFLHDQTLPEVTADVDYGLSGLGGTKIVRGFGVFGPGTGEPTGEIQKRGYGTVLGDLFSNSFPRWTAALTIRYPIGTSQQEASVARARLQYNQSQTQLRNQQLQIATQVRQAARQVQTNQQRVQTTRSSRELAERSLDAEQRKFAAGTSTNFLVFQAQRDLAQARNNELKATVDYQRSVVDLETVQEVPVNGLGATTTTGATTGGATTTTAQ